MGLFSKKKKTYVSSVSYNLSQDTETNYLQSVITNSILASQTGSLASDITGSYLNGQGMKLKNAYKYGRDHYSLGLPTSTVVTGDVAVDDVKPTIEAIAGKTVIISETYIGSPDYSFWVYQYLADHYGYDESTSTFANPPSGVPATGNTVDSDITSTGEVRVTITPPSGSVVTFTFDVTIDNLKNYLYVPYRGVANPTVTSTTETRAYQDGDEDGSTSTSTSVTNAGETTTTQVTKTTSVDEAKTTTTIVTTTTVGVTGRMEYFIYQLGLGTYPALDALEATADLSSPYYPWVVMRDDNKDMTAAKYQDTDQYKTAKKLLTKAGLKMTELADAINSNGSIGDIDFAFVHFGIALNTQINESREYLFQFFRYLMGHQKYSKLDWENWYTGYKAYSQTKAAAQSEYSTYSIAQPGTNSVQIRYSKEYWYNVKISWQYINLTTTNEVIGNVGTVTVTCQKDDVEYTIYSDKADTIEQYTVQATPMIIKKQVSATQCEVLEIIGAQHDNKVYNGKSVTTSASSGVNGDDDGDSNFIVPLNRQVFEAMGIVDITQTCYDCMHITFNSYKTVKQKWYQTGIFKLVVIVIAIVITVLSWGTLSAPAAAVASAAAAAGATATGAPIAGILTPGAVGVAVSMAMKIVAHYVSPDLFAIFSVALLAYGAYAVGSNYAATGEFSASTSLASSQTYMAAMNTTLSGYQTSMQYAVKDVAAQITSATNSYNDQMDAINDAMKTLNTANYDIDLMALQSSFFSIFESSESFINRTTSPTNAIAMVTGQVNSYVDSALNIDSYLLS